MTKENNGHDIVELANKWANSIATVMWDHEQSIPAVVFGELANRLTKMRREAEAVAKGQKP